MTSRRTLWAMMAALPALAALVGTASGAPQLKALIVDGQNNHNWKATTPVMKQLLEGSGLFTVDVATSPPKGKSMEGFSPQFANYDVVVSNYNGAEWPQATKDAFVKYMKGGGGLVIVHAADNSFPKWPEFNEMIGLGGWGGRNEASGPYVYWKDGKFVRDTSKGRGGGHGSQTPYLIEHRLAAHPITKGLPAKWMHCADELYSWLRGPAKNMTILATAFSDPKTRGSGRNEPVLWTVAYGKGRVFHTVLGHADKQMRCVGFIVTFLRGTEWAATGKVTQTKVPDDFPTATAVSVRANAPAAGSKGETGEAGDAYAGLASYKPGDSRAAWAAIEQQARGASAAKLAEIEGGMLDVLKSPKATFDARQYACRVLRRIGTDRSVSALAALLADEKLSHMARFALQHMPGEKAAAALRDALGKLGGKLRIGMIGSLGQRRDVKAVGQLTKLLSDADTDTVAAAISALGTIGGAEAAKALAAAKVPAELRTLQADARLKCADAMAADGQAAAAVAVYRELAGAGNPTMIRIAAYRGLTLAEPGKAAPALLALLKDDDLALQRAAGQFLTDLPGTAATKALAAELPSLPAGAQVLVLAALTARGDKAAAAAVSKCIDSADEAVAVAAVNALAVLGDAGAVERLVGKSSADGELGTAARGALERMKGEGVAAKLAKIAGGDPSADVRKRIIEVLAARRETAAMNAFFKAAADKDRDVRRAGLKAVGMLAGPAELPRLVAMLIDPAHAGDRGELERALGSVVARSENADAGAETVIDALAKADDAAKPNLLAVLPRLGGAKALAAVRKHLAGTSADVKTAAVRAMSSWPDASPMADLLKVAKSDASPANRALALRGYVKMLSVPANRSSTETTRMMADALKIAGRPQEKKAILAALPRFPCEAALSLTESLMADSELAGEASLARQKIKSALVKKAMSATAAPTGGSDAPAKALDGDQKSRWSTGRPMKPGDWFMLDLGREATVSKLTLDTRPSGNDWPRGYEVYVSFDGKTWGTPALVGKGDGPVTELAFKTPVAARYIKIVQTGSHDKWNWSIHSLKIDMK